MAVAKEQIRQIIAQNDISSVEDVYVFMKEGFREILIVRLNLDVRFLLG